MKKSVYKRRAVAKLVGWSIVLVVLVSVLASLLMLDGGVNLFSGGFSIISGYIYPNAEQYNVGNATYTEGIRKLDIDWIDGSVTVKIYNGSEIKLEEGYSGDNEDAMMRTRIVDGTLYVKYAASGIRFAEKTPSKGLTVYLPLMYSVTQLDEINIETVAADVFIRTSEHVISCRSLEIGTVSGKINSDGVKSVEADIESVSGNITASGVFDELDISTVSARVNISASNDIPKVSISTVSGDIELTVPSYVGFKAELDTLSGRMKFKTEYVGRRHDHGNGKSKYDFDTVSGNVEITLLYE